MKMKFLSIAVLALALFSCSSDDDNNNVSDPTGMYHMTAFNLSDPQDLDGDGEASNNILLETTCFDNSFVQINADNTFTASGEGMEITGTTGSPDTISCFDDGTYTGTWTMSGNTITFSYEFDGDVYTDSFDITNNTIQYHISDGQTVGTTDAGDPVTITTDIDIIYTKM